MKRILLEFIGGPWDGMNLCNDSPDRNEASLAVQCYLRSNNGRKGTLLVLPADYAVRPHDCDQCTYRIAHRTDLGNEVLVRLEVCDPETGDERVRDSGPLAPQIIFRFEGGCLHGMTLDSRSPDLHEALLAAAYYTITDGGTIGNSIDGTLVTWSRLLPKKLTKDLSESNVSVGTYRVIGRTADRTAITVTLRPDILADGPGREGQDG
jgi:hypothetical protein